MENLIFQNKKTVIQEWKKILNFIAILAFFILIWARRRIKSFSSSEVKWPNNFFTILFLIINEKTDA